MDFEMEWQETPRRAGDNELFKDILKRNSANTAEFLLGIQWILYARRPMRPEEFYCAVLAGTQGDQAHWKGRPRQNAVDNLNNFVYSSSKGLAEITNSNPPTVRFIHESIRDFLIKDGGIHELWPNLAADFQSRSHDRLKNCCYIYLQKHKHIIYDQNFAEFPSHEAEVLLSREFPFLEYATHQVLYHANIAAIELPQHEFLKSFDLRTWISLDNLFAELEARHTSPRNLLYILAQNDFARLINAIPWYNTEVYSYKEQYVDPLVVALASGYREAVRALLHSQLGLIDSDSITTNLPHEGNLQVTDKQTPLSWAAEHGYSELVQLLLDKGADSESKDSCGWTPLLWAASEGHQDIARLLVEKGANLEAKTRLGWTPLWLAMLKGHEKIARLLAENGANLELIDTSSGWTPLSWAMRKRHLNIIQLLVENGADLEAQTHADQTPLLWAASGGHQDVIQLLVEKGADLEAKNSFGWTPLWVAMVNGHKRIVRLLAKKGANLESKDNSGWTPLLWAANEGHQDIVQLLVGSGACFDVKDSCGWTPLWLAALRKHRKIIQLLVDKGADVNSKDISGRTPLSWARHNEHKEIEQLMIKKGARIKPEDSQGSKTYIYGANDISLQLDKPTQGRKAMRFTPYHDLGYTAPGRNSSKTIQTTVYDLNTVLDEPSQPTKALSDDATMADSRTQSFFAPGAKEPPDRDLLNGLAKVLLRNADLKGLSGQARDRVSGISPQLLESFSERLASGSPSKIYYDVAVFICKYRHEISTYFMQHINQNPTEAPPSSTLKDHTTIKAEYGSRKWQGDVAEAVDHETIDLYNHDEERGLMEETDRLVDEGLEDEIIQTLRRCKEIVHGSLAHSWLLLNLKKEVSLMQAEPNIMDAIRTSILSPLPPTRIFDGVNFLRNFGVRFNVEWDPLKFFTSQFKGQARDMLELTLTLTGSFENAQAATCMSYIQQTWPSSGEYTVKLLSEVLMEPSVWNECNLPDDTALSAQICESKLVVIVLGTRDAIAEIGEQLAWISAALRLAPDDQGIYGSRSSIRQIEIGKVPADLPKAPQSLDACFDILCGTPAPPTERHSTGQCWHDLFKNPTIVHGYPIPRRARENTGLEIPLHILADLVQTAQISTFGEKIFLKGFSSMLVLMDQIEDSTLWHLDLNRDGSYISYADASKSAATKSLVVGNIMKNIMRSRHIVGWCLKAKFYTGTDKAPYPVKKPALDAPNDKCILYQTRPSWVKVIEKQPSYYRTHREEPAHMHYGGDLHHRRLERLKDKYVNLWDVESERGWLVNGVSALLHLLRARLEHVSEDDSHGPKLKELSMPDRYTVGSSIKFFKNLENMNLAVYPNGYEGEGRPFTIMDQSGRLYNALDNLIESQAVALRQQISASRKYLSGWAFRDLATEKEQLEPYAITLPEIGRSWVDFTRAISTVTLFGRDFGELIRPGKACEAWAELPRGRSFLATSGQVLRRIMDDVGNSPGKPWRLGRDIVWHNPTRSCKCSRTTQSNHAVNIQVLLPEEVSREVPQEINTKEPEDDSAFIFGFNFESSWLWGEFGYPTKTTVSSLPENFKYPTPGDSGGGSESGISDGLPTSTKVYTVGILCTLPEEGAAMKTLFDIVDGEPDNYVLGSIGDHNVALAYLPLESGIAAASAAASRLVTDFPSIRFGFLVGIAGGVPSSKADIRLGDVVVGVPQDTHPGVIQLGRGKDLEHNGFQRTGSLNRPPQFLLAAIASMIADSQQYRIQLNKLIERIVETKPRYRYPGQQFDVLYSASCHECTEECSDKDSHLPDRRPRDLAYPVVHRGLIGSSDRVLKDSKKRDQLAKNYGILCVEMEAAGVMRSDIPFLVIRGISDYADSHKNDQWHSYASLTAAAFAKMLLCKVTGPGGPIKHNQRNLKRSFSHHNSPPRSARRRLDEDASYSLDAKS